MWNAIKKILKTKKLVSQKGQRFSDNFSDEEIARLWSRAYWQVLGPGGEYYHAQ